MRFREPESSNNSFTWARCCCGTNVAMRSCITRDGMDLATSLPTQFSFCPIANPVNPQPFPLEKVPVQAAERGGYPGSTRLKLHGQRIIPVRAIIARLMFNVFLRLQHGDPPDPRGQGFQQAAHDQARMRCSEAEMRPEAE